MGIRAFKRTILILGVIARTVLATNTVVVMPYVCSTYPCPPPNKLPTFDDGVFDLTNKSAPKSSQGLAGKERYLGEELNYNSAQRSSWMKECKPKFYEDMSGFRQCFDARAAQATEAQGKQRDEVNRRENAPLRNVPPRKGKETGARPRRKSPFTGMPR